MKGFLTFGISLSAGYLIGEQLPSPYKGIKLMKTEPGSIVELSRDYFDEESFKMFKSRKEHKPYLIDYCKISDLFISEEDSSLNFGHINFTKSQGIKGITHGGFTFTLYKYAYHQFLESQEDTDFKHREVYVRYKSPAFCNDDFYIKANYAFDEADKKFVRVEQFDRKGKEMGYAEFKE